MKLIKRITSHCALALAVLIALCQILDYYNPTMSFLVNDITRTLTYVLCALSSFNAVLIIISMANDDLGVNKACAIKERYNQNDSEISREAKIKAYMEISAEISRSVKEIYEELGFIYTGEARGYIAPGNIEKTEIAKYIDHTILKNECSYEDVKHICDEAKQYGFASVCVNPSYISFVSEELKGSEVCPCCVIGFPFGSQTPEAKAFEAADAVANGAREVDMVINVGAVKNGEWKLSYRDINEVVKAIEGKAALKVIIETCLLTDEEKVKICTVAKLAGAQFVKTSTGFSKGGATAEDVALMRAAVGPDMGVKASGGIRSYEDAVKMIKAGANRLGCSAGVSIVS